MQGHFLIILGLINSVLLLAWMFINDIITISKKDVLLHDCWNADSLQTIGSSMYDT
jgi:hypothetical protein